MKAMFHKHTEAGYRESLKGIQQKTLAYGEKTLMVEFRIQKGAVLPKHKHPHEQIGYAVSGLVDLTIGTETNRQEPGDSWCIPGDTEHGAKAVEDSVVIEVFSPVREDYLPASCL
jgi:quercetin dioxygenase-like cupin family protein